MILPLLMYLQIVSCVDFLSKHTPKILYRAVVLSTLKRYIFTWAETPQYNDKYYRCISRDLRWSYIVHSDSTPNRSTRIWHFTCKVLLPAGVDTPYIWDFCWISIGAEMDLSEVWLDSDEEPWLFFVVLFLSSWNRHKKGEVSNLHKTFRKNTSPQSDPFEYL